MANKPTIYEALRDRLRREPTNQELRAEVQRIKEDVLVEQAGRGQLRHQKRRRRRLAGVKRAELPGKGRRYKLRAPRRDPNYRMPSDFTYSPKGKPCKDKFSKAAKGKCMVQFVYDRGYPALRFCTAPNKPGLLVRVKNARDAAKTAREACACFERSKSFTRCLPKSLKLGKAGRRRRR